MKNSYNNREKYFDAKERVKKIKGFYKHLIVYITINTILTILDFYSNNFNLFSTWFYWGIGIVFHALGVFGKNIFLSNNWEKRKIQELMDEENKF